MAEQLINGIYPPDYLFLTGVDQIQHPEEFWWASREHLAPHADFLELDYGRVRQINYMKMGVLRAPIDITIYYDAVSDDDGSHKWVEVTPVPHEQFDDTVHYSPGHRNMFQESEFYFTDRQGNTINTRYVRIRFKRRDEAWPHKGANQFKWSIMVKGLRSSRFTNEYADTLGTLFDSGAADDDPTKRELMNISVADYANSAVTTSGWVEQEFMFATDVARGWNDPDKHNFSPGGANSTCIICNLLIHDPIHTLWPSLLGFSVLGYVDTGDAPGSATPADLKMEWQFLVDTGTGFNVVKSGITHGAVSPGRTWINTYFDPSAPIETNATWDYKVRVRSLTVHDDIGNNFFGKLIQTAPGDNAMFYRLWGDVGDTGRDVLGNFYRYGTRVDTIERATELSDTGWMSEPRPTPSAVEALYFDTRYTDDNDALQPAVIDSIKISPRTPGVEMHVYYTDLHLSSATPQNAHQYDHFVWTPVQATFKLTGTQRVIDLPAPIRAAFVKLEFTKLQPQPFKVPTRPDPPTQSYRRYPTWVEMQFRDHSNKLRHAINQYFTTAERRKEVNVHYFKSLRDPVREFEYKERVFLTALAANEKIRRTRANDDLINRKKNNFLDPTTMSKIHVQTPHKFQGPLTLQVDRDSVLGQIVANSQDVSLRTINREAGFQYNKADASGQASRAKLTISFDGLANTPIWFNRTCAHVYAYDSAKFGKVAYFAGIDFVQFLRKDYTIARDDTLISESFHDLQMIADSDWVSDQPSKLYTDVLAAFDLSEVFDLVVDYTIDGTKVTGEQFNLADVGSTYTFATPGLTRAVDVHVYSDSNPLGTPTRVYQYTFGKDYDLTTDTVDSGTNVGKTSTTLNLDVLHARLITQAPS